MFFKCFEFIDCGLLFLKKNPFYRFYCLVPYHDARIAEVRQHGLEAVKPWFSSAAVESSSSHQFPVAKFPGIAVFQKVKKGAFSPKTASILPQGLGVTSNFCFFVAKLSCLVGQSGVQPFASDLETFSFNSEKKTRPRNVAKSPRLLSLIVLLTLGHVYVSENSISAVESMMHITAFKERIKRS